MERHLYERNDNIDKDSFVKEDNRRLSRKNGREELLKSSLQQLSWDHDQQSMDKRNISEEKDNPKSPFRLSPSGRHRSDYEVDRLIRIERNEKKVSQLGLLYLKICHKAPTQRRHVLQRNVTCRLKRYRCRYLHLEYQ